MASMRARINQCLKAFLMLVNAAFTCVGLSVLGIGIYLIAGAGDLIVAHSTVIAAIRDGYHPAAMTLIGCGCLSLMIGLLGCLGVCRESVCSMIGYILLLSILLVMDIAGIALALVYTGEARLFAAESIRSGVGRHYGNLGDSLGRDFTAAVDWMQREMSCCGCGGPIEFFADTPWWHREAAASAAAAAAATESNGTATDFPPVRLPLLPASCCHGDGNCTAALPAGDFSHAADCCDQLTLLSGKCLDSAVASLVVSIALQILCIGSAAVLLRQIAVAGRVIG